MMIHIISTVWIPIWSIASSYHNRLRRSASRGGLSRAIPTIRPGTPTQGIFGRDRLLSLTKTSYGWSNHMDGHHKHISWYIYIYIYVYMYIYMYIYVYIYMCFLYFRANPILIHINHHEIWSVFILIILLLGPFIPIGHRMGSSDSYPYPMTPPLSVSRCVHMF